MIIKEIIIKNFLPFKEQTVVQFSTDPQKNITILLAENNVGKTSFLKAFLWCLYGNDPDYKENILNAETRVKLSQSLQGAVDSATVKLFLSHNNEDFLIAREWKYTKKYNSVNLSAKMLYVQKLVNGYWETIEDEKDQQKIINTILPEDLSTYFFFEEKKFQSIGTTNNIKKSVEDFCGLTSMNSAIKDLNNVVIKFNRSLDSSNNKNLENTKRSLITKQDLLNNLNLQLKNAKEELAYYQQIQEENTSKLISYAKDEEIKKRYQSEKNHLERVKQTIPEKEKRVVDQFNKGILEFLENKKVFREALKVLDNAENGEPVDTISGIDVTSIEEIIKRGYCICGTKITNGSEAYQHLLDEKAKVPPNNLSNSARDLRSHMATIASFASNYYDNFSDSYKDYKSAVRECNRTKDRVDELFEEANKAYDTTEIRQRIEEAKGRISDNEGKIERLTGESAKCQRDIELLNRSISKLSKNNEENIYIDKCKNYAIAVKERIDDVLKREQATVLQKMNQYVQGYFKSLYHGNLNLSIDENYNIRTFNSYSGEKISTKLSTGTNDIKNFAFVFGLERLAKDHINESDEDETTAGNEPYPLILDGPFSHTDGKHIENMCALMPQVANQVIIAISRKDWQITKPYLDEKVAKVYEMKHITEEQSIIRPSENGEQNV